MEHIPLSYLHPKHRASTVEVSADATQEPNCVEAAVSPGGGSVTLRVEREFEVELVAETKVCVKVCTDGCGDYEDKDYDFGSADGDYDDLDPDLLDDEL